MSKRLKIFFMQIFMCLCVAVSHAQVRNLEDTLSSLSPEFYKSLQAERSKRQKSDSLYFISANEKKLKFIQSNISQLVADTIKQASILQLQYNNVKKKAKLPVEAFKTKAVSLYTEGFTTIGKAKIMGKFYFDKTWDDSLANNLNGNLQNGEPFTHFATKAGKYERQNLNFEAGISYLVLKKLSLNSLVNYDYHWSTGSIDPRPDNKILHIEYAPGLTYQFGKTALSTNYTIGKVDQLVDIGYKNKSIPQSSLYPDRRIYVNNGYGYIAQYISESYSRSKDKIDGWGLSVASKAANWYIKANYSNTFYERKSFTLESYLDSIKGIEGVEGVSENIRERIYSKYELLTQKLSALIYNENFKRVHQISFKGIINEGTGLLMSSPSGANYLFDEHNASLEYLLSIKKDKRVSAEFGFDASVNHFTKKDFLSQHFYENTTGYFSLYGGKYIYRKEHNLKITLKPGIVFPLLNNLSVPETQKNIFTQSIAYPEYSFRGNTFFNGQLSLVYYTPFLLRLAGSAINLDINYLQKLKNSDIDFAIYQFQTNAKTQLSVSLGFQIFL